LKKRSSIFAICVLLALVTLACYWPVTAHKFVGLDDPHIYANPQVSAGLTSSGLLWAFQTGFAGNWQPLTWISHMVDCQIYGLKPAGHHITNLLLHAANTLLLFLLFRQMTGSLWRSAGVAALFAWHPLHVESVAWAAERKDVLSTLFFLLTLWAYVRYVEVQRLQPEVDGPAPEGAPSLALPRSLFHVHSCRPSSWYWTAVFLFALGLMSKPMLVTLPFVLLLLDVWPLNRLQFLPFQGARFGIASILPTLRSTAFWRLVREKLPFFALALAASLITYRVQQTAGAVSSLETLPLQIRISNALVVYVRYLSQSLWPAHLAVIYPYSRHLPVAGVIGAALLLAGLSIGFIFSARRRPFLTVGWFWYLGTLVPTIGLVQVGSQSMADRYMYIPSVGLFLLIVWGAAALLDAWPYKRHALGTAGALALGACLFCTRGQLKYWQDSEHLFRHAIVAVPNNYVAYEWLGGTLETEGKSDEAFACHAEAVRLDPHYPETQYRLGTALMNRGKLDEAIEHLSVAVKNKPTFAAAHSNLGSALLHLGRLDEAKRHFSQAVELSPDDAQARYNLGTVLLLQSEPDEAIASFTEALRLNPNYKEAHGNLGVTLMKQGKVREGMAHLGEVLRLDPRNPESHFNLGVALLQVQQPVEAANQFSEALELSPDVPKIHYHLALALIRHQKSTEALDHAQKARELARNAGQKELAARAEELLKAGQAGTP
jgi:tetratricopeptide (TPR) repeat protein